MTPEIRHLSDIADDALRLIRAEYWRHMQALAEELVSEHEDATDEEIEDLVYRPARVRARHS